MKALGLIATPAVPPCAMHPYQVRSHARNARRDERGRFLARAFAQTTLR